ncbi:MAG: ParA family protein [Coriobacteriia bacterium]|nr:ParA family protein [Coriobacteriia bacterium]
MVIVTGHYGSGKTNLSLNMAIDLADADEAVTLVDLDIVNPYFRSSDYIELLEERGIRVIGPTFARSTLESPSLPAEVYSAFEQKTGYVIFDVGGDDAGATALGRYAHNFTEHEYDLVYVINKYRNLTTTAQEAAEILHEIEEASHLKATGVIHNSHLQELTNLKTLLDAFDFAVGTAEMLDLPLVCATVPTDLFEEASLQESIAPPGGALYPVKIYVRTPWDEDESVLGG